ncbi:hypothetical protein OUZ56_009245 [Daphnia magna]|uniref:Uncharacterized protein n=1 Tax=Daphnia magna TaxID=35525 RepID=A0ABR0AFE6_9CRUS|nr:hypothetical protein OUZ56_009245 [Daphnia magna]
MNSNGYTVFKTAESIKTEIKFKELDFRKLHNKCKKIVNKMLKRNKRIKDFQPPPTKMFKEKPKIGGQYLLFLNTSFVKQMSFFAVRCINRNDVHFLDVIAHQVIRIQADQTHEVFRCVRQLTIQQRIHQQNVLKKKVITKCRLHDFHAR